MDIIKVTHNTPLWFGRHKGKRMSKIPAKYLLAISKYDNLTDALKRYLKENAEVLKREQFKSK